jgi:hypothetical protein
MTSRQIGETYSSQHSEYSEATQYCYYNGMHELTLFWSRPTLKEKNGFLSQPVELALHIEESVLFLLYRIVDICEWSDVAFNIHQLRDSEKTIPADRPGQRGNIRITLVNADNGIIVAKRMLSISPVMTQALRHSLQEQFNIPCPRSEYDAVVQKVYAHYPDSSAILEDAWMMEVAEADVTLN